MRRPERLNDLFFVHRLDAKLLVQHAKIFFLWKAEFSLYVLYALRADFLWSAEAKPLELRWAGMVAVIAHHSTASLTVVAVK